MSMRAAFSALRAILVGALLVTGTAPAGAARPFRIYMVLWRGETQAEAGFRDYLAEHRLPVEYIVRNVQCDAGRLPELVGEIKATRPDLVYSWGSTVTLGIAGALGEVDPARHVTDIPIVFTTVTDPLAINLVSDPQHPARNLTGTSHMAPIAAQMKGIAAYSPLRRLGNIYNPAEVNSVVYARQLEAYAREHRIELVNMTIPLDAHGRPDPSRIGEVIGRIAAAKVDFLYLGPDSFIGSQAALVTETAVRAGLKVFAATEEPLRNGRALFGLVSPYYVLGRLTASKALQILEQGKSPQDIPVEGLSRFSYVVNIAVARRLNAFPPLSVVRYADVLVE